MNLVQHLTALHAADLRHCATSLTARRAGHLSKASTFASADRDHPMPRPARPETAPWPDGPPPARGEHRSRSRQRHKPLTLNRDLQAGAGVRHASRRFPRFGGYGGVRPRRRSTEARREFPRGHRFRRVCMRANSRPGVRFAGSCAASDHPPHLPHKVARGCVRAC